jgi:G3E family GTPase
MSRLAAYYTAAGKRVGLVTNDQAEGLVDTRTLAGAGYPVGEVAGACFCCKFDDLVDAAATLTDDQPLDIILAEPVGSCTDLVATVLEPLSQLHGAEYKIGPLAVLLKPEHGQKILRDEADVGFSPKAAYIFLKQLEEADIIVVNKADKLSTQEKEELVGLLETRYPEKKVVLTSLQTGFGFDHLTEALATEKHQSKPLEIDYDTYAAGEAELGWLNADAIFDGVDLPLDDLAHQIVVRMGDQLAADKLEVVHLKVLCDGGDRFAVANLVSSHTRAELSQTANQTTSQVKVVINARVAADPAVLSELTKQTLQETARLHQAGLHMGNFSHFRPGRPKPTHRLAEPPPS